MARINIPKNPGEKIKLAKAIETKHATDGAASPLNGVEMEDFSAKLAIADAQHKTSEQAYRDAEKATESRDVALGGDNAVKGRWNTTCAASAMCSAD